MGVKAAVMEEAAKAEAMAATEEGEEEDYTCRRFLHLGGAHSHDFSIRGSCNGKYSARPPDTLLGSAQYRRMRDHDCIQRYTPLPEQYRIRAVYTLQAPYVEQNCRRRKQCQRRRQDESPRVGLPQAPLPQPIARPRKAPLPGFPSMKHPRLPTCRSCYFPIHCFHNWRG